MEDQASELLLNYLTNWMVGYSALSHFEWTVGLFTNDLALAYNTALSAFTPCSAPGYAPITLSALTNSYITEPTYFTRYFGPATFEFTGPGDPAQTIYGHYCFLAVAGYWTFAQLWPEPFELPEGDSAITLNFTLQAAMAVGEGRQEGRTLGVRQSTYVRLPTPYEAARLRRGQRSAGGSGPSGVQPLE